MIDISQNQNILMLVITFYFAICIAFVIISNKRDRKKYEQSKQSMLTYARIPIRYTKDKICKQSILLRLYLQNGIGVGDNGYIYMAIKKDSNVIFKDGKLINKKTGDTVNGYLELSELFGYRKDITIDEILKLDLLEIELSCIIKNLYTNEEGDNDV